MSLLTIENQSTHPEANTYIPQIAAAIQQQLTQVASLWGDVVWHIFGQGVAGGYKILLLDDADVPGALGYHDIDANGQPYAKIFVNTVLKNGGTWVQGALSISCVISHEVLELIGDPLANLWSDDLKGALWAHELCDAVEGDYYTITMPGAPGQSVVVVAVSNFVAPDYFNPLAPTGADLDFMRLIVKPFEIAPNGYAIKMTEGTETQTYGDNKKSATLVQWGLDVPQWKREAKLAAGRVVERLASREIK